MCRRAVKLLHNECRHLRHKVFQINKIKRFCVTCVCELSTRTNVFMKSHFLVWEVSRHYTKCANCCGVAY
jgi:hypothetical protein